MRLLLLLWLWGLGLSHILDCFHTWSVSLCETQQMFASVNARLDNMCPTYRLIRRFILYPLEGARVVFPRPGSLWFSEAWNRHSAFDFDLLSGKLPKSDFCWLLYFGFSESFISRCNLYIFLVRVLDSTNLILVCWGQFRSTKVDFRRLKSIFFAKSVFCRLKSTFFTQVQPLKSNFFNKVDFSRLKSNFFAAPFFTPKSRISPF